jgi:hypothetical protein
MNQMPRVLYWHLWVDGEGTSHQTQCAMNHFELKAIQPNVPPQWEGAKTTGAMSVVFMVLPPGWIGDWHENPKPQWIVPVSGSWFVEAMDGTRVEMGPGECSFGADQNCKEQDGRRGHRSGTVGDDPAVLMVVQFEEGVPLPACQGGLSSK